MIIDWMQLKKTLPIMFKLIPPNIIGALLFWLPGLQLGGPSPVLCWAITVVSSIVVAYIGYMWRDQQTNIHQFFYNFVVSFFASIIFWGLIEIIFIFASDERDGFAIGIITIFWLPLLAFWSASWFVLLRFNKFRKETDH